MLIKKKIKKIVFQKTNFISHQTRFINIKQSSEKMKEDVNTSKTKKRRNKVEIVYEGEIKNKTDQMLDILEVNKTLQQNFSDLPNAPENWITIWENISKMRSYLVSPVDTMVLRQKKTFFLIFNFFFFFYY